MAKKPKRPRDPNQFAKSILDIATKETPNDKPKEETSAVKRGRLGGIKGGKARAEKLSPAKRKEIAKKAAQKRWGNN